jgi:hypothetical protein
MSDKETVLRELETFINLLNHIQNSLAKALYYIPEFKEKEEKRLDKRVIIMTGPYIY